ncbi:MAG: hypothetical protein ACLSG5_17360 [Oscillospiraceae bacterium]
MRSENILKDGIIFNNDYEATRSRARSGWCATARSRSATDRSAGDALKLHRVSSILINREYVNELVDGCDAASVPATYRGQA